MSRPTYLTINTAALKHNLELTKRLAKTSSVMAMVKANAYGHGITRVSLALTNADAYGVASLEEGILLREARITHPIILMEGLFYPEEIEEAAKHHFTLVIHHLSHVEMLEKAKVNKPFSVWLKINTGMNRLGIAPSQVQMIYQRLLAADSVHKPIGWMTHFAQADDISSEATPEQIAAFTQATSQLPGPQSLANSAGIIAWPKAHADWIRPGLMLYGASPFPNKTGLDHGLRPVMTLSSHLIAITLIKRGDKVGYGGTWIAPEDMLIGVVGVGYGDGYPQYAKNGTPVLVNNIECAIAGRVSMDMLTVDLRRVPHAKIGDPVILWGEGLPVEKVAEHSNTSAYEVLTRMTPRPKMQVV